MIAQRMLARMRRAFQSHSTHTDSTLTTTRRARKRPTLRTRFINSRRGFALLTVLLIAIVGAVIALASGMLAMSNVLVQASSDRAAMVDDAALSGLENERSRMNARLDTVPLDGYKTIESNALIDGSGGVRRTTWISRLGNSDSLGTTGEFGVQAEVVSQAIDPAGNVAIRRVQMYQESFARYASFTDQSTSTNGSVLWWALGAQAQGPVHSNDIVYVWGGWPRPQVTFFDKVTTARYVLNKDAAEFRKGAPLEHIARIPMPTSADLDVLKNIAGRAGYVFTPDYVTGDSGLATMRIDFVAIDADGDGNTTGPQDGYFRVYKLKAALSANPPYGHGYALARTPIPPGPGSGEPIPANNPLGAVPIDSLLYSWNCGIPQMVAGKQAMPQTFAQILSVAGPDYRTRMRAKQDAFDNPNAQCYLGGDERLSPNGVFRATDSAGYWVPRTSGSVPASVAARPDGAYLWPLSPSLNSNFRGVIFAQGKVGVSGTVRGRVTLASRGILVLATDLKQATSPAVATGTCLPDDDIVGLFSGEYGMYSDNSLATPQWRRDNSSTGSNWMNVRKDFDSSPSRPDLIVHASIMALKSVVAENSSSPGFGQPFVTRGTYRLIGGTIEQSSGQTGTMTWTGVLHGYYDDVSFNQCALKYPPPYFPTTGRWTRTQFYEVNPQGFSPATWFTGR